MLAKSVSHVGFLGFAFWAGMEFWNSNSTNSIKLFFLFNTHKGLLRKQIGLRLSERLSMQIRFFALSPMCSSRRGRPWSLMRPATITLRRSRSATARCLCAPSLRSRTFPLSKG